MALLRKDRRVGANLRRPPGLGLVLTDAMIADTSFPEYSTTEYNLTTADAPIADQPLPGDIISDPIAPPPSNVTPTTTVVDESGGTVAMPTTTATSGTNATDGSAPTVTEMTAPDNTVIPIGSYVAITDQAWVISLPDGQTRIIYLNQPIVDPECANLTTADINAGKVCMYNIGVPGKPDYFEYRYIPTERWTGQVQSAGELRGHMDYAATLQPNAGGGGAFRNIWYNNPSWHMVTTDPSQVYDTAKFPNDYVPTYIGPTETSGGSKMYIIDAEGTPIDVTSGISTPEQQAAIDEAIYGPVETRSPGQPGYVPPVYSGPPIDETGSIINYPPSGGGGPYPPTGGVSPTLNIPEIPAGEKTGTGMLMIAGLAALFLLRRKR